MLWPPRHPGKHIAGDHRPERMRQGNCSGPVVHRGIGVVQHHRRSAGQRLLKQVLLPTGLIPVVREQVLAHVRVRPREVIPVEGGLAASR